MKSINCMAISTDGKFLVNTCSILCFECIFFMLDMFLIHE